MARPTKAQREARELWDKVREGFASAEEGLKRIIETKAWEPLGYASFAEAWRHELNHVRLTTDYLKAQVVYAFLDQGLTASDIGDRIPVDRDAIDSLVRQRDNGVPADFARVRTHFRKRPSEAHVAHVPLKPSELTTFRQLCESRGVAFEKEAAKGLRAHFRSFDRIGA